MKKAIVFGLIAVASVFSLAIGATGCSGSNQGEDQRAQQKLDAQSLEQLYGNVVGKWQGTVSNPSGGLAPFKAELTLYTYYVQSGVNPDGSAVLRPTLRGQFRPLDFVSETDVVMLVGDYDRSGRLVITAQGSGAADSASMLSLRGQASSGGLSAEVIREGGVWGVFDAKRVSRVASAPGAGEVAETRERYLKVYGKVEGRYYGTLKSIDGNDYNVELAFVIVEKPQASGVSYPALMAQYKRLDAPAGTLEWSMNVNYNSQTGEVYMREASTGTGGVPGGWILSISGQFKEISGKQAITATVRNKSAVQGTVTATRF